MKSHGRRTLNRRPVQQWAARELREERRAAAHFRAILACLHCDGHEGAGCLKDCLRRKMPQPEEDQ